MTTPSVYGSTVSSPACSLSCMRASIVTLTVCQTIYMGVWRSSGGEGTGLGDRGKCMRGEWEGRQFRSGAVHFERFILLVVLGTAGATTLLLH